MTTRAEYFTAREPDKARWRTARTWKRCYECNGEIRELDRYFDTGVVHLGKYETVKLCLACARADVPR
jgi:uncharacterized protein with PIN domain